LYQACNKRAVVDAGDMGFDSVLQDVPIDDGIYMKHRDAVFGPGKSSGIDSYMNDFGQSACFVVCFAYCCDLPSSQHELAVMFIACC
jgi:hypothetical protein